MRAKLCLIALAIVLCAASASAGPVAPIVIQNFEIVTASNLSPVGGLFSDGSMFAGTFSVSISQLPTGGGETALPSVDITTTSNLFAGVTYTSGEIIDNGTATVFGLTLQSYILQFRFNDADVHNLTLEFVEVPDTFTGGQIVDANEVCMGGGCGSTKRESRSDTLGDAIAVDPALAVPEPWSAATCSLGLLAVCLLRRRPLHWRF